MSDNSCFPKKRGRKPKTIESSDNNLSSMNSNSNCLEQNNNKYTNNELNNDNNNINENKEYNKKRGRKPKIKNDDNESKELKKRGRKPKAKNPEELLPKVPKKRGRKPKDKYGIVPKITSNYLENQLSDNIILHLPVHSSDILSDPFGEHYILKYDPDITTPVPYEKDIISGNTINHCPYPFDQDQENDFEKDIDINDQKSYNCDSNFNNIDENIVEDNNNDNNINLSYLEDNINNDIDMNIKFNNDINIISNNENLDEYFIKNLNERNKEVNLNNLTKNKLLSNMIIFKNNNKKKNLPSNTNINCWWCCHSFENYPYGLPSKKINDTYFVSGCFCSAECASSWNFNTDKKNYDIWECYSLLNSLYPKTTSDGKIVKIKCAPPRETLNIFGGSYSIDDFRELNNNYCRTVNILYPPMISIIPHIEENYIDLIERKDNYIPIDIERIKKVNNDLKLKRNTPLNNPNNTLENCMNLKYI